MLDDAAYGTRDKRGDWKPSGLITYPPVFTWPAQGTKFLKWFFGFPGYILPYNLLYAILGVGLWLYLMPEMETMKTLSASWIVYLLAINFALVAVYYGLLYLPLYVLKRQGNRFRYNARWPSTDNSVFLFRNQTLDNMVWAFGSAIPIATACEAVVLWAFANGYMPFVSFEDHPVYFVTLIFLVPLLEEIHFYIIHRLIHWPPLYRSIHSLHHNNVNPGPWSGLAMHPVEHLLYFSGVFIYWILPAHPIHMLFHFMFTMLAPAPAHSGFDRLVLGGKRALSTDSYAHYLHHKYFECNYTDGVIPLDKWFGTFHDGSPAGQERMNRRLMERTQKRAEPEADQMTDTK